MVYVREYACSKDCKLLEPLATANQATDTKTEFELLPPKWTCTVDTTPVASAVPVNPDRVVYKMTCEYLCGNKYLDLDTTGVAPRVRSEQCDIGDHAFHKLDSVDGYKKNTGDKTTPVWVSKTVAEV